MSLLSLVKINYSGFEEAIHRSLDLIHFEVSTKIKHVVIKPNLNYYLDYTTGHTTDPQFVAAYAQVLRNRLTNDVKISVVESDASAMKCRYVFRMLGYDKLANQHDLTLVNLTNDPGDPIKVTVGSQSFTFRVPSTIAAADLLVNIAKMKYTIRTVKVTCAMKNIFGCIPYPQKYRYHEKLGETIVAINKAIKPDICTVEGNIVYGEGTRRLGLVMSSRDGVAVDAACAQIMGISPRTIPYLKLAEKEGLGHTTFETKGVPLTYFAARYPRHKVYTHLKNQVFFYLTKFGLGSRFGLG